MRARRTGRWCVLSDLVEGEGLSFCGLGFGVWGLGVGVWGEGFGV